jgi:hypothetical protein
MKIKTTTKAFMSMEIIILLFSVSIILNIYNQYMKKKIIHHQINSNKEQLLIVKKYLCTYIKKYKCIPPMNKVNEIEFDNNDFLNKVPKIYKTDINKKPFKIYKGNINQNEIIYLTTTDLEKINYKIIIYGHDLNIYNPEELKDFLNLKEKRTIILINNEHSCTK